MSNEEVIADLELVIADMQGSIYKTRQRINRLKQQGAKKPVDLSVLIESGIDCEFQDAEHSGAVEFAPLRYIANDSYPYQASRDSYEQCRPRMDHNHAWVGGKCPLPEGIMVHYIMIKNGEIAERQNKMAVELLWDYDLGVHPIVCFRIAGLAEGYCWPWEVDNETTESI